LWPIRRSEFGRCPEHSDDNDTYDARRDRQKRFAGRLEFLEPQTSAAPSKLHSTEGRRDPVHRSGQSSASSHAGHLGRTGIRPFSNTDLCKEDHSIPRSKIVEDSLDTGQPSPRKGMLFEVVSRGLVGDVLDRDVASPTM
jgi:hypothetical protein